MTIVELSSLIYAGGPFSVAIYNGGKCGAF